MSIDRIAMEWMLSGDTGMSSKAICRHMQGIPRDGCYDWPHDPADLGRCLRLLALIPLWELRIPEMAGYGAHWRALVERWAELKQAMTDEVGIDWSKGRRAPKTYALMRSILDPIDAADQASIRIGNVTLRSPHD